MTHDEAVQLFTHMEWADALIWTAVGGIEAAQRDRTLMERLHHVHVVQRIYLQMWLGDPDRGRELSAFADITEVQTWAREYYRDLWAFTGRLDPATLSAPVEFPWAEQLVQWFGEVRPATVQETITQVSMHSAHHRGQLCTLVRQFGGEPPLVDFIGWVWMGKPKATWRPLTTSYTSTADGRTDA